jgi:hypothetical protein
MWTGLAPAHLTDSTFMSDARAKGQQVGVTAGSSLRFLYGATSETSATPQGTPQRLTPIVSADNGEPGIVGRVWKEQNPATGATVLLLPSAPGDVLSEEVLSRVRVATAAANGSFAFHDLPSGPYRIYAFDRIVEPQANKEELFGRYRSLSKEVVMNPFAQTSVELNLIDTGPTSVR